MDREEAALKFLLNLLLNRGVFHPSSSSSTQDVDLVDSVDLVVAD
jgi:hypothetical protein